MVQEPRGRSKGDGWFRPGHQQDQPFPSQIFGGNQLGPQLHPHFVELTAVFEREGGVPEPTREGLRRDADLLGNLGLVWFRQIEGDRQQLPRIKFVALRPAACGPNRTSPFRAYWRRLSRRVSFVGLPLQDHVLPRSVSLPQSISPVTGSDEDITSALCLACKVQAMEQRDLARLARQAQALADALARAAEQGAPRDWRPVWKAVLRDIVEESNGTGEMTIADERAILRRHLDDPRVGMRLFREGYLARRARGPVRLTDRVRLTPKGWSLLEET